MTAGSLVAHLLLWAGTACVLLSAAGLLLLRDPLDRLHALAPATGLGVPLIALAVAVDQGAGRAAVKTLFIGLLLAFGGTATTIEVARTTAREEEGKARDD